MELGLKMIQFTRIRVFQIFPYFSRNRGTNLVKNRKLKMLNIAQNWHPRLSPEEANMRYKVFFILSFDKYTIFSGIKVLTLDRGTPKIFWKISILDYSNFGIARKIFCRHFVQHSFIKWHFIGNNVVNHCVDSISNFFLRVSRSFTFTV